MEVVWRRRRVLSCMAMTACAALTLALGHRLAGGDATLAPGWVLDGVLLGLLLRARPGTRLWLMIGAVLGMVPSWVLLGHDTDQALAVGAANLLIAGGSVVALRTMGWQPEHLTAPRGLAIAATVALAVAPLSALPVLIAADDAGWAMLPWRGMPIEALGLAVTTPLTLNLLRRDVLLLLVPPLLAPTLVLAGLYAALAMAVSLQEVAPMYLVLCPALLLLVGRLGPGGAGLGIMLTLIAGTMGLLLGRGPLIAFVATGPGGAVLYLLAMLTVLSTMVYALGAAVAERRRMNQALADQHARLSRNESLYRLLTDHASDIITRVRLDGRRLYVSPGCTAVLGWTPHEMMQPGWQNHVHPADLAQFRAVREQMVAGSEYVSNTYRYARKDGSWCWLEARLHLVRQADGTAKEFVANLRDVTRQKEAERALECAMAELSEKASTDGLTGVANRGRFDEALDQEWRRAMRGGETVALLLIDADHFKAFNDRYGHQAGDTCLKAIASSITAQIRRPHDLAARYGGEEFAVILPATSLDGALDVGERVRAAIEALDIPHEANADGVVTVSIGAAAAIPTADIAQQGLLEAADAALYSAKRDGRNRVQAAMLPIRSTVVVPLLPHRRRAAGSSQADRMG